MSIQKLTTCFTPTHHYSSSHGTACTVSAQYSKHPPVQTKGIGVDTLPKELFGLVRAPAQSGRSGDQLSLCVRLICGVVTGLHGAGMWG